MEMDTHPCDNPVPNREHARTGSTNDLKLGAVGIGMGAGLRLRNLESDRANRIPSEDASFWHTERNQTTHQRTPKTDFRTTPPRNAQFEAAATQIAKTRGYLVRKLVERHGGAIRLAHPHLHLVVVAPKRKFRPRLGLGLGRGGEGERWVVDWWLGGERRRRREARRDDAVE